MEGGTKNETGKCKTVKNALSENARLETQHQTAGLVNVGKGMYPYIT